MPSLYNDQFAFIHVPKTGGSWAMRAMWASGVEAKMVGKGPAGHAGWSDMPPRPFRFGFVRHPVTWYRSYWVFIRTTNEPVADAPLERLAQSCERFPDFAEAACENHPGVVSSIYRNLLGPPGAVEYVGRYESLADDLLEALELSGTPHDRDAILAYPPFNVSPMKPDVTEVRELIEATEAEAMERFYVRDLSSHAG